MILLEVVLQDGDAAYMNLSLTCSCFRAIVTRPGSDRRHTMHGLTVSVLSLNVCAMKYA